MDIITVEAGHNRFSNTNLPRISVLRGVVVDNHSTAPRTRFSLGMRHSENGTTDLFSVL